MTNFRGAPGGSQVGEAGTLQRQGLRSSQSVKQAHQPPSGAEEMPAIHEQTLGVQSSVHISRATTPDCTHLGSYGPRAGICYAKPPPAQERSQLPGAHTAQRRCGCQQRSWTSPQRWNWAQKTT